MHLDQIQHCRLHFTVWQCIAIQLDPKYYSVQAQKKKFAHVHNKIALNTTDKSCGRCPLCTIRQKRMDMSLNILMRLEVCLLFPVFHFRFLVKESVGIFSPITMTRREKFHEIFSDILILNHKWCKTSMKLHTTCLLKTFTIDISRRVFMKTPTTKQKAGEQLPHHTLPSWSKTFLSLISLYHPFIFIYNVNRTDIVLQL